jgi:hypothetical protein
LAFAVVDDDPAPSSSLKVIDGLPSSPARVAFFSSVVSSSSLKVIDGLLSSATCPTSGFLLAVSLSDIVFALVSANVSLLMLSITFFFAVFSTLNLSIFTQ